MSYQLTNEDKKIIELWEKGFTGSQIANEVGKTRNAIMGKIYRLRAHRVIIPVKNAIGKPKTIKKIRLNPETFSGPKRSEKPPRPLPPKGKSTFGIVDVLPWQCRYIVSGTSSRDYVFCKNAQAKRSYCQEHYSICYIPSQPKRNRQHFYQQPATTMGKKFYDDPA